jgi:hypothetical protein
MNNFENIPNSTIENLSVAENLKLIADVFKKIEEETVEIANLIFEYLIDVSDADIIKGSIPNHSDAKINKYINILNRLFKFSRKTNDGGFRIIDRNLVQNLDKKTYIICMCFDGGVSMDILCDVVNTENSARTPSKSPVRVVVKQAFVNSKNLKGRRSK